MILVLDGADASGKTTLARYLIEYRGARYIHTGPYRDQWRWHLGSYLRAQRLSAAGELVVVDRHWLSECAYGEVYRGGSAYPIAARCFDRLWLRSAALTVLCVPSDLEAQERDHFARELEKKGNVYSRDRAREVKAVIAWYADLARGNVVRPGTSYATQMIRANGFATRPDVVIYDRFVEGSNLKKTTGRLLRHAAALETAQVESALRPDRPNLGGHTGHALILIVGESASPTIIRPDLRFPFVDRDTHLSAATWLNRALHEIGLNESHLCWTNARDGAELKELLPIWRGRPVLALGRLAESRARSLGYRRVVVVEHPRHHRRFYHRESYAIVLNKGLREALR